MKKIMIVALLFVSAVGIGSLDATPIHSMSYTPIVQDYCPKGYVCEATNCTAVCETNGDKIKGIAIYKNKNGDVLAYVPGHGHLRCTQWKTVTPNGTNDTYDWCINVNDEWYKIIGYRR